MQINYIEIVTATVNVYICMFRRMWILHVLNINFRLIQIMTFLCILHAKSIFFNLILYNKKTLK